MSIKIELTAQEAIDVVALIINYEVLAGEWFENNEPAVSVGKELGQKILGEAVKNGLSITDIELKDRTRELAVTGVKI